MSIFLPILEAGAEFLKIFGRFEDTKISLRLTDLLFSI